MKMRPTFSSVPLMSADTSTTSRMVGWKAFRVLPMDLAACGEERML